MRWVNPPKPLNSQCCLLRDLIEAEEQHKRPVLNAEHARHVLEIMCAIEECLKTGGAVELKTTF